MNSNPVHLEAVLALAFIGIVLFVIVAEDGAADHSFSGTINEDERLFYDITVDSTSDIIEIEVTWEDDYDDIDISLFNPEGEEVESSSGVDTNDEYIGYDPDWDGTGKYSLAVVGYDTSGPVPFTGTSTHPIQKASVEFSGSVGDERNVSYSVNIATFNKPLLVTVKWDDSDDTLKCELYDSTGRLHRGDESDTEPTHAIYIWFSLDPGTYSLRVIGHDVQSSSSVSFTGTGNYPVTKAGSSGGDGSDKGGLGAAGIVIVAVVAILVVVAIVGAWFYRSKVQEAAEVPPSVGYISEPAPYEQQPPPYQGQPMEQPPAPYPQQPAPYAQQPQSPMAQPYPPQAPTQYLPQQPLASYQQPPVQPAQYPTAAGGFCQGCGAPLQPGMQFCSQCGRPA